MATRIRLTRKLRGLTLQELADKVGTTPQTIQRLETNNMTVSIEWLERIGQALQVNPATLLSSYKAPEVTVMGELVADGSIRRAAPDRLQKIEMSIPGEDSIAITVADRFGPHETGTILIATRVAAERLHHADGRDCLVEVRGGRLLFRRMVLGKGSVAAYVPYEDGGEVERNLDVAWVAPVVMAVRYMPAN
jgi:transcriptional regulator with XRE-family HTH domain